MSQMCAWCNKGLGGEQSGEAGHAARSNISHGICGPCEAAFFGNPVEDLRSFLDDIKAPVVLVDGNMAVRTANREARRILGKELPGIEGYLGGDVFACANAKLPAGCGNTEHCNACTLRSAVESTVRTGEPVVRQLATLDRGTVGDLQRLEMRITTEKVGKAVLLRVDEIAETSLPET